MASTKYNKVKKILVEGFEHGLPKKHIAALCGISRDTLYDWIDKGERGIEGYADISDTIKKAQANFVLTALKEIRKAGNKQWTAYAWMLERRESEHFAKLDKLAMTDPTGEKEFGQGVQSELEKLKTDELIKIADDISKPNKASTNGTTKTGKNSSKP